MAAVSGYMGKNTLDWITGGAASTQPAGRWMGLAWGTPNSTGGSELNTSFGYSRLTVTFAGANSPQGSCTNLNAMTFGPFSSANESILGLHMWDGSPVNSSNMLLYGTLQTARTAQVGDSLVIGVGALAITIT